MDRQQLFYLGYRMIKRLIIGAIDRTHTSRLKISNVKTTFSVLRRVLIFIDKPDKNDFFHINFFPERANFS